MTSRSGQLAGTRARALGFWMNLPERWLPVDSAGGRIPEQVTRLLDERAAADPQVAAHRGQVERQLRQALRAARSADLAFAAILATFTRTGLPIAASLALTRHRTPDGSDATRILTELGRQTGKQNSLLELPFVGTVVRSEYLDRIPVAGAGSAEIAVYQYYLPLPTGPGVIVATGATPTLPLRSVFGDLFDAIISTFQYVDES